MTKLAYIVLIMGVALWPSAKSNDICTICNCIECPLDRDDYKEIMDAVVDITDEEKKAKHIRVLHEIYVQSHDKCKVAAENLQKELLKECPELEEVD